MVKHKRKKIINKEENSESFRKTIEKLNIKKKDVIFITLLFVSIILYAYTYSIIFGIFAFIVIIAFFVEDSLPKSSSPADIFKAVKELAIAFLTALAVWVILCIVLNTSSPIDVVTSCSMEPVLQRGDLILLHGENIAAPVFYFNGPIKLDKIKVVRKLCRIKGPSGVKVSQCTNALQYAGKEIKYNASNPIIVYQPDAPIGLIIHRAFAKLQNKTTTLYLTKGDNNEILDQEAGIPPVKPESIHGKEIFRIPLVGYVKLLLFMQFGQPEGCDKYIIDRPA